MLVECSYIKMIWIEVAHRHGIRLRLDRSPTICLELPYTESNADMVRRFTVAIVWNLLLERNRRTFCDTAYSLDHCIYSVTNDMLLWTTVFGDTRTAPHASTPMITALNIFGALIQPWPPKKTWMIKNRASGY